MKAFEEALQKAIHEKVVANAVVEARLRDSDWTYKKTAGKLSLDNDSPDIDESALFCIYSCSKLITSLCVLQCVEKGLITLDTPLGTILPEFASPDLITHLDPTTSHPHLTRATTPLTLRHLLTHTSGLSYPNHPSIQAWIQTLPPSSRPPKTPTVSINKEYLHPLLFEPGTPGQWVYGTGIDWAGVVVERLNGNIRLGEYMKTHIFDPLGMKSTTFHPLQFPAFKARICPRASRSAQDGALRADDVTTGPFPLYDPQDDSGGSGLWSTASDLTLVLESLLRDDGKILKAGGEMMGQLFTPQLVENPELQARLAKHGIMRELGRGTVGGAERGVRWNWGLGGVLGVEGVGEWAGVGTMWWDGVANCYWFIDRSNGNCGFYGSQILPPSDKETAALVKEFQKGVCAVAKSSASS